MASEALACTGDAQSRLSCGREVPEADTEAGIVGPLTARSGSGRSRGQASPKRAICRHESADRRRRRGRLMESSASKFALLLVCILSALIPLPSTSQAQETKRPLKQLAGVGQEAAQLTARFAHKQLDPNGNNVESQNLERRSSFELALSSGQVPAELRSKDQDDTTAKRPDAQPSRLAKLCQQTSSVLASVLPAPFGGHKRSILCQFFGQVQLGAHQRQQQGAETASQQRPLAADGISPPLLLPGDLLSGRQESAELPSVAVIQQQQRPPVTLTATGRHPIQLVLEHEQQQAALAAEAAAAVRQRAGSKAARQPVGGLPWAPRERQQVLKFSAPLVTAPSSGTSSTTAKMGVHSNAWRTLNSTPAAAEANKWPSGSRTPTPTPTYTPAPPTRANGTESAPSTSSGRQRTAPQELGPAEEMSGSASETVVVAGTRDRARPDAGLLGGQVRESALGKRTSGSLKMATRAMDSANEFELAAGKPKGKQESEQVRTIEVVAQQPVAERQADALHATATATRATLSKHQQQAGDNNKTQATDLHQVHRREELVIASINNLTRIAFGNQLRDTVKVISRLIDRQNHLMAAAHSSAPIGSANSDTAAPDRMLTSESRLSAPSRVVAQDQSELASKSSTPRQQRPAKVGKFTSLRQQQVSGDVAPREQSPGKQHKHWTSAAAAASTAKRASKTQSTGAPAASKPAQKQSRGKGDAHATASSRSDRKESPKLELRRLSATSTSAPPIAASTLLSATRSGSARSSRKHSAPVGGGREADLRAATTISELSRREPPASSSPWLPAQEPPRRDQRHHSAPRGSAASSGATALPASKTGAGSESGAAPAAPSPLAGSHFAWLIPDRDAFRSVSPHSDSLAAAASEQGPTLVEAPEMRREKSGKVRAPSEAANMLQATLATKKSSAKSRFEPKQTTKMDSLTTLKMSLLTSTTNAPATGGPQTSGTQSRWIPTTMFMSRPTASASSSTTSAPRTTTTTTTGAAPTIPSSPASQSSEQAGKKQTTLAYDLLDSQASDSISKYTTHHLRNEETLLATTRRQQVAQLQPQTLLPQIAQTGDYFSAETIASWPERYQTMIEREEELQHSPSSRATTLSMALNSETTRRNGEFYDGSSAPNELARHRFTTNSVAERREKLDDETTGKGLNLASTIGAILANTPGITILPSNHKLSPASESDEPPKATSPMMATWASLQTEATPTVLQEQQAEQETFAATKRHQQIAPYTLDGLSEQRYTVESSGPPSAAPLFVQLEDLRLSHTPSARDTNHSKQSVDATGEQMLRPPYHGNTAGDAMLLLDASQRRPHVVKKLYESFVPSTKSPVGGQQRFNLSALKYLAQQLLAGSRGLTKPSIDPADYNPTNGTNLASGDELGEQLVEQEQEQEASTVQMRLLELLAGIGSAKEDGRNSSIYYELFSDESGLANETSSANRTAGKGFFVRAGNLLNDLKQLEQKRAAALLAAIRYQVPGPVVRPWDTTNDLARQHSAPADYRPLNERRLDTNHSTTGNQLRDRSLAVQLLSSLLMKPSTLKQKLVGREELEARLTGLRNRTQTRRSDGDAEYTENDLVDFKDALDGKQLEDLKYILAGNGTANNDGEHLASWSKSRNVPSLLERLLQLLPTKLEDQVVAVPMKEDFETIDLTSSAKNGTNHYPRYIRMMDYQTAWTQRPNKSSRLTALANLQPASEIAARLQSMATATTNSVIPTTEIKPNQRQQHNQSNHVPRSRQQQQVANNNAKNPSVANGGDDYSDTETGDNNFDCVDRMAGFYPDIRSSCRTFYHCSNTGHLLTFNCPTQMRFDERSLKCGPWYEVPCDLGRLRTSLRAH